MKFIMKVVFVLLALLVGLTACGPKPEPILDQATVVARNASVRIKNSSTSRTIVTLNVGDKVDVLERVDNWYRIRHGERTQGWMEESTVVTSSTVARIKEVVIASQDQRPQNTATLREEANFRIEPGRSTAIIRRLEAGSMVEVLERVTKNRPGSKDLFDMWLKVRPSPTEVGWVLASLVGFDIPADIAQYSEGYTYAAVKRINQVQDSLAGPINWYVVGERSPGLSPHIDFDGVRVFTWNLKRHRYETAYRMKGLRGIYPLEIGQEDGNPSFRVHEMDKEPRSFVMYGVVVRESSKKIS
jgi:SH3-like domain-containing protein